MAEYNENNENSNESRNNRNRNKRDKRDKRDKSKSDFIEKFKKDKKDIKTEIKKTMKKIQTLTMNLDKEYDNVDKDWDKFKKKKIREYGISETKWDNKRRNKTRTNFQKMKNKKVKGIEANIKKNKKGLESYEKYLKEKKTKFKTKIKVYNIFEVLKKNNDEFENMYDKLRLLKNTIQDIETKRAFLNDKLLFSERKLLKYGPQTDSYSKYKYANKVQTKLSKKIKKFLKKCS